MYTQGSYSGPTETLLTGLGILHIVQESPQTDSDRMSIFFP